MSSYLSSLLTNTSSRYASLRALLPSGSSEADGDTEDDTHICRVLRAYYTEKGRPLPAWLPPDPKAPQPAQIPQYNSYQQVGAGYGGLANAGAGGSKLGSLWDSQPAPSIPKSQSLRQGGGLRGATSLRGDPMNRSQTPQEPAVQARPLPSQRAGSYQNTSTGAPPGSSGSASTAPGGTAQDRLKARLWGAARSAGASPTNAPTPALANTVNQVQAQNRSRTTASGGSGSSYDRGANPYGSSSSSRGYDNSYDLGRSSGGGGGSDQPFVAATAPWATNESEFSGGGGGFAGYGGSGARQGPSSSRQGLPTGPASRRPPGGHGLPNGPRGMR